MIEQTGPPGEENLPHVLMVTQSLRLGGLERMILNLCVSLKRQEQCKLFVFAYDHDEKGQVDLVPEFRKHGIEVEVFKKRRGFSPAVVYRMLRRIERENIGLVHCHDLGGLMYAALVKILSSNRVKLIHTQHSFVHLKKHKRYRLYEKIFTRLADTVTVVSEATRDIYLELGFPRRKIRLIENGVDFLPAPQPSRAERLKARSAWLKRHDVQNALRDMRDAVWILYLARIDPVKGQMHALSVWSAMAPAERRQAVLLFVGPEALEGELARLQQAIGAAPDKERIMVAGGSDRPHEWIEAADIFLSCSEYEGMPLGPLEAIGSGLPAVLSRIPGHEFLKFSSVQFAREEPQTGARALEEMIRTIMEGLPNYHRRLWDDASWIREGYSLSSMAARYGALYAAAWNSGTRAARFRSKLERWTSGRRGTRAGGEAGVL